MRKTVLCYGEKGTPENPDKEKEQLSQEKLEKLIYQYGVILGKLHSMTGYETYGFLHGAENGRLEVAEDSEEWPKQIAGVCKSWVEKVEEQWENPPEIRKLVKEYKSPLPENPSAKILHCDNRLENILIQGSKIIAFLDWTITWTGHTEYDLARAEYLLIDWDLADKKPEEKDILRSRLIQGYRQEQDLVEDWCKSDRRKVYRYATTLFLAAGFCNWGKDLEQEEYKQVKSDIIQRIDKEEPKELLS